MNTTIFNAAAIAAVLASGFCAGGALAQSNESPAAPASAAPAASAPAAPGGEATAEQKPKPKPKPMINVVVANNRSIGLVELDAALAGSPESKKLVTKLGPGKKATARLPKDKGCVYNLHGTYDDGTSADLSSIDLCKDGKINLVE